MLGLCPLLPNFFASIKNFICFTSAVVPILDKAAINLESFITVFLLQTWFLNEGVYLLEGKVVNPRQIKGEEIIDDLEQYCRREC